MNLSYSHSHSDDIMYEWSHTFISNIGPSHLWIMEQSSLQLGGHIQVHLQTYGKYSMKLPFLSLMKYKIQKKTWI